MGRTHVRARAERPIAAVGKAVESLLRHAGAITLLALRAGAAAAAGRVRAREVIRLAFIFGVQSVPLVVTTAVLTGVVTAQQGRYQFTGALPMYLIGGVVVSSMVLELGPVITAFVVIGRVGARTTAELGAMKVSDQLDALKALGRDPVAVLVAPRVLAAVAVMPLLVALADGAGIVAGLLAARQTLGVSLSESLYGARLFWNQRDLVYSLGKGLAFGLAIPLISIHMGIAVRGGAEGVARNTTSAVVFMILAVLVLDALFAPLFLI